VLPFEVLNYEYLFQQIGGVRLIDSQTVVFKEVFPRSVSMLSTDSCSYFCALSGLIMFHPFLEDLRTSYNLCITALLSELNQSQHLIEKWQRLHLARRFVALHVMIFNGS
jgi:hypothetical protein